jgi:hypothetical protein
MIKPTQAAAQHHRKGESEQCLSPKWCSGYSISDRAHRAMAAKVLLASGLALNCCLPEQQAEPH